MTKLSQNLNLMVKIFPQIKLNTKNDQYEHVTGRLTNASQTFSFTLILKLISVLDILFLYSQDIQVRPFKSSFWLAILQIKPDKIY